MDQTKYLFLPIKHNDERHQSVECQNPITERNTNTTKWRKRELVLEVVAIEQYYSVQYIVNTVIYYHFVNKIRFQGSKETHTSEINYEYKQNGWNLEMQGGVQGNVDFRH